MDKVRNEEVRRRLSMESVLAGRRDLRVLRLFRYLERMDKHRMAMVVENARGMRVRGRPRLGWINGMKFVLASRGMTDGR